MTSNQQFIPKVKPPDICWPLQSRRAFIKWAFPCFLVGCGGFIGSGGLHYATHNFVHEMMRWEAADQHFATAADKNLSKEVERNYTSMEDPFISWLGARENTPMGVVDKVAVAIPALFCVLCLVTRRVEVWTKVMVCTALLAMVKGIIGAITTVPDSSDWEVYRDQHLQADGFAWMSQTHTFWEVFTVDTWWIFKHGHPLRYCSDMMYSGHTFFVTLYALGLYEVALIWTHMLCQKDDDTYAQSLDRGSKRIRDNLTAWASRDPKSEEAKIVLFRMAVLGFVSAAAILQQSCEIYFVLKSHFHYTSDVFVAVLFTFLFYTNGVVTIFAKQWSLRDVPFLTSGFAVPTWYLKTEHGAQSALTTGNGDDLQRAKEQCSRLCCTCSKVTTENPPYVRPGDATFAEHAVLDTWMTRGDIFLPCCCVPFCCLAGREHVYSDSGIEGIRDLPQNDAIAGNEVSVDVLAHMHMHKGISQDDVWHMLRWMGGEFPNDDVKAASWTSAASAYQKSDAKAATSAGLLAEMRICFFM